MSPAPISFRKSTLDLIMEEGPHLTTDVIHVFFQEGVERLEGMEGGLMYVLLELRGMGCVGRV